MKDLTNEEFAAAPTIVKYIYGASLAARMGMNTMVGYRQFEDAVRDHPEYFPEEVEHRRRWALIPQHVHECYFRALRQGERVLRPIASPGLRGFIDRTAVAEAFNEQQEATADAYKALEQEMYDRYYLEYLGPKQV